MKVRAKYPETIHYVAKTEWDGKTGGTATASEGRIIVYDTPKTYGGNGNGICPDEMFVSAVLGCLMNTFLDFQRKTALEVISITLDGEAVAKFDSEGYQIVGISVKGEVVVEEDDIQFAERAVVMMKKYCHLTRSIKDCIPITYDVKITGE